MRKLRIDFAIPLVVAFGVGALINSLGGRVIDSMEADSEITVYSDSEIGAAATDNVPVVSSIDEMMEEDYFTFYVDKYSSFSNSIYYEGTIYDAYEMESGEYVVVDDYYQHSDYKSNGNWSTDLYMVLPIGQVIHKPLDQELIDQFEEAGYTLSDTSFYVDMRGDFKEFSRDNCESILEGICFFIGFIIFLLIRFLLIASGLFPPLFPLRFLKSWKKFVVYYGIIYYDDEIIERILACRKKGQFDEAAEAFCELTNASLAESKAVMNKWSDFYGEGILTMCK